MKLYSMTATFGKLHHETLQLSDGLNIIEAPNEWGKSTWCAFLIAMLYGIDTRQQTTKAGLADKERYLPWSGEPMSGRMELSWNGRDITIERSTKGRIPFGEFRVYETATGLAVPELTAANCGQQLLGVEKAVFTRAGFIRLQDMPVTQDENLRRRLNSLVTTGDESGAGDTLGKQLKELKNKVRYNRSGLLPQAEYEREQLRAQLQQRQELQTQAEQITARQEVLEQEIRALQNHADALRYEAAQQGTVRIRAARENCELLQGEVTALEAACSSLPKEEAAQSALQKGKALQLRQRELLTQQPPAPPAPPDTPALYQGMTPEEAVTAAQNDLKERKSLQKAVKKLSFLPLAFGIGTMVLLAILIALCSLSILDMTVLYIAGGAAVLICGCIIALSVAKAAKGKQELEKISQKHPGIPPQAWVSDAQKYQDSQAAHSLAMEQYRLAYGDFTHAHTELEREIHGFAGEKDLEQAVAYWQQVLESRQQLAVKRRELKNAAEHLSALEALSTTAPEPSFPDSLTENTQETETRLQHCLFEQKQLQIRLGQCIGQSETIGQEAVLKARLDSTVRRIARLEDHYRALELAQEVLYQASSALQRRFAPRISKRAQDIFTRLTGGRYQRLGLSDDLSLSTSAENEDTLRAAQWRSDGTVDQLYLSLRLAVAGELTPEAPLVLDDALIRFDDTRLKAALELLKEEAGQKQVILFTCQSRENNIK